MPESEATDVLLRAVSFAARKHDGHYRKDRKTPYFAHPVRVVLRLALQFGVHDVEVLAAAVLHDTLEDTRVDRDDLADEFGERVAEYVALLSQDNRLAEEEREEEYFARLKTAPVDVQLCKLGDVLDNLSDASVLSESGRQRALRRAKRLVEMFASSLPAGRTRALELVRSSIRRWEERES